MSNSNNKKLRPESHAKYRNLLRFGAECQSCLSQDEYDGDSLLECYLCNGRVHQACMGQYQIELDEVISEWYCERCETIRASHFEVEPERCYFCPCLTGVMRRILYNKQVVWSHPECYMRDYPLKLEKSKKIKEARMPTFEQLRIPNKAISDHWVPRPGTRGGSCSVCSVDYGETTKCKIPGCQFYFHITCGIREGIVREQGSMNVKISQEFNFYIPFYCPRHLEERYEDYYEKISRPKFKGRESELAFMVQKIRQQIDHMKAAKARMLVEEEISYFNEESESRSIEIEVDIDQSVGMDIENNSISTGLINIVRDTVGDFQVDEYLI